MLRPRVSALTRARPFVQRSHTLSLTLRRTISTLSRIPERKNKPLYLFLGIGVVSAAGFVLYPHTVHADADTDWVSRQAEGPPYPPDLAPGLRGIACAQTHTSGEDMISITYYPFSNSLGYLCIGIFDGHSGANTATDLYKNLSDAVIGGLVDLYSLHMQKNSAMDVSSGIYLPNPGALPNPVPPDEEIDDSIRKVFIAFDNATVHEAAQKVLGLDDASYAALQACNAPDAKDLLPVARVKPQHHLQDAVRTLSSAWTGSCALLGLFNVEDRSLRVALTGDSRAVLGRRVPADNNGAYTYEVHPLTSDQNANNPDEAARLVALHPDEPDLLKNKRVVGWGPSRAFGDGSMKWSRAVQMRLEAEALGDPPRAACKTPPYFTAEPVVTTMKDVRKGDFVVFATDGLWDCLTNEEVVGLVGQWLEDKGSTMTATSVDGKTHVIRVPLATDYPVTTSSEELPRTANGRTYLPSDLPVVYPPSYKDSTTMYEWWRSEKKFICEDELVAVHLMRNALGGANIDLGLALLDMRMPRARKYRDDISIAVIFFD